jgi:UDP-3-O-[3-hydroxymyristoyl] glucosamine N-acyltransferase
MVDHRFHRQAGPFTLGDLAAGLGAVLANPADAQRQIKDVAPLSTAGAGEISFLDNPKYLQDFLKTKAEACIIHPKMQEKAPTGVALLLDEEPYRAYAMIAARLYPQHSTPMATGVHPTAIIHATAVLGHDVSVGPYAVIGAHAVIGDHTVIDAHSIIGEAVQIGMHSYIGAQTVISHSLVGSHVIIYPGAKIGQAGFGFYMHEQGYVTVPQLGRVILEDGVEVGANTTIDRGALGDTIVGRGTRIDNLVQLGHNVETGRGCVLVAQVGIAGSTKLGNYVIAAGQVGISGHLTIGNQVKIAAQSGVLKNISDRETVAGCPAIPIKQWHRQIITLAKMTKG